MSELTPQKIIKALNLQKHPLEGGYYRRTFSDTYRIKTMDGLDRCASTCIYYLITPGEFSELHLLSSSEIFHFYLGHSVEMIQIDLNGNLTRFELGPDLLKGQLQQVIVPPNTWQGVRLIGEGQFALFGCSTVPGFEFKDYMSGDRQNLSEHFPQHKKLIQEFTRIREL
jgi:predicted cupin superfamily sugar epimerase